MTSVKEVDIIKRFDLTMEEQKKYEIIKKLVDDGGNKDRAALTFGIIRRQVDRLAKAYKERGKDAFVHGNRGRKPAVAVPEQTRKDIVSLYTIKYPDANFTHFTELLARNENISVSVSCVASILEESSILSAEDTGNGHAIMVSEIRGTVTHKNILGNCIWMSVEYIH